MIDPLLNSYGQPILPAGINTTEINGDELNGAGVNEPVWPVYVTGLETFPPIILDEETASIFDKLCPDYVPRQQSNVFTVPAETETIVIRGR